MTRTPNDLGLYKAAAGCCLQLSGRSIPVTIRKVLLVKLFTLSLGKCLIIGGGIANFTNVASTFKGIVRALTDFQPQLVANKVCLHTVGPSSLAQRVQLYYNISCPNYQENLCLC